MQLTEASQVELFSRHQEKQRMLACTNQPFAEGLVQGSA